MPKTLPIAGPVSRRAGLAPIALFALAYLAVLGVLFAPDGFFLSDAPTQSLTAPATD
jgi:hypothetical protein